jgi:L-arabinokinase
MFKIVQGSAGGMKDVEAFVDTLNSLDEQAELQDLFDRGEDVVVTRAPGRLDVMGGIADYSGSLVLQLPTREATFAAVQLQAQRSIHLVSLGSESNERDLDFELPLSELENESGAIGYAEARALFQQDARKHWAAYAAGAFLVLMREKGTQFPQGARILISSDVPEGKGVSSSAAIEVAVMQALTAAFGLEIKARELAILCQKVENLVVGAPCGVMDQMTASCGQEGQLLTLLCQPAELQEPVAIPDEIEFWGLDSGVRHSVSGADYGSVRVGAFMGYRMIADQAGLKPTGVQEGKPLRIKDPIYKGYLANVSPSEFQERFSARLPDRMSGQEFLDRYKGTTDTVTKIDPEREYAVHQPASHPIHEHFRVRSFAQLLGAKMDERTLELLGELMYQSHWSYSACALGSGGTDKLVHLVRKAGPARGLYGAKITGGGSGGTVAVLGRKGSVSAVKEVADEYARQTGHQPYIFAGSSSGSAAFGSLRLRKK